MSFPEFIVLNKKDGTGRVGVSVPKLASIEEVMGANTATQYTIVTVGGGAAKSYTVSDTFHDILKAMNYRHLGEGHEPAAQTQPEVPAGG